MTIEKNGFVLQAIEELIGNTDGGYGVKDQSIHRWTNKVAQPTDEEINTKSAELKTAFEAKKYQRDRKVEYPEIGDQLDMIYWDKKNSTDLWKEAIDKVKSDNPKP